MKAELNLLVAWLWILLGFISGLVLGLFFQRESWLGGYASFKRRMYRLAHISFFGLGFVNFLFALTPKNIPATGPLVEIASWTFVLGALTMPLCCVVMAHYPKAQMIFAVPVVCLIFGGGLTLTLLVHKVEIAGTANTTAIASFTVQPSITTNSLP
jgi:hypothetical protein